MKPYFPQLCTLTNFFHSLTSFIYLIAFYKAIAFVNKKIILHILKKALGTSFRPHLTLTLGTYSFENHQSDGLSIPMPWER